MDEVDGVRLRVDRVQHAVDVIDPVFLNTPALPAASLGELLGCSLTLKIETLNSVRCFKGRGTETAAALAREAGAARMVCASAGNLGQALAYSGVRRGIGVTVVAGRTASPPKLRQIASLGATVEVAGHDIEDARIRARELVAEEGGVPGRGQPRPRDVRGCCHRWSGVAAERSRTGCRARCARRRSLASGVGYVAHAVADNVEVSGIQPLGAPAMARSWQKRTVIESDSIDTIADGVAGRCPIAEVLQDLLVVLDDVALVREESIKAGMRLLDEHAGLVVEPSAALGIAALPNSPSDSHDEVSPRSSAAHGRSAG